MNIRETVVRGAGYQLTRRGVSIALNLVGSIVILRALGAYKYGLFAIAGGIIELIIGLTAFGIPTYLIRKKEPPDGDDITTAFTMLFIPAAAVTLLALAVLQAAYGTGDYTIVNLIRIMAVSILLQPVYKISMALMEHRLEYKKLSFMEFLDPISFYGLSIPLLLLTRLDLHGLAIAYVVRQLVNTVVFYIAAPFAMRFGFKREVFARQVNYGIKFEIAMWIWGLNLQANKIIVGWLIGPRAVGLIEFCNGILLKLHFIPETVWRMSLAAFGKIQDSTERLSRAVAETMTLVTCLHLPIVQAMTATSFIWIGPLFGEEFTPASKYLPFLALATGMSAVFMSLTTALFAVGQNMKVIVFHIVYVCTHYACSIALIKLLETTEIEPLYGFLISASISTFVILLQVRFFRSVFGHAPFAGFLPVICVYAALLFAGWTGNIPVAVISIPVFALFCLRRKSDRALISNAARHMFSPRTA